MMKRTHGARTAIRSHSVTEDAGADPGVGKGRGTNKLSVARWLENRAS